MGEKIYYNNTFRVVVDDGQHVAPAQMIEAEAAVQEARSRLQIVDQLIRTSYMKENMRRQLGAYFNLRGTVLDPVFTQGVLLVGRNIQALLAAVSSKDLELKPVIADTNTVDAAAFVRMSALSYISESLIMPDPKKASTAYYGPLHLRFDRLFPLGTAAANLVHEAAHRYVGARDWAYLPNYDLVEWEDENTKAGIPLRCPKSVNALKAWYEMSTDEALNNADSYGGFVAHACT